MNDITISDRVRAVTVHRADAPIGRTARFHLNKRFSDLPCCHRSWSRHDKRVFLHGYELTFEIEFACTETETRTGLVVNNRCLNEVRAALQHQFDHTTLIAADDPQRNLFEQLAGEGVIDLRIMNATSMEGAAAWVFDTVEHIVAPATDGRVWVSRIAARESRNNVVTLTAEPEDRFD
ncbi:6-pyruvoyl tetrahydropterin synthase [Mycobacterium basiliense]|uniref:6-carboxy-5,6,7,8-tetrahydropterin synthase n=1 Tax=Mycobacterium basiliense TaxID=2094119 RepID=A0A3S4BI48_9MYCO|nr:6-carboxytetrahydropterin synthase [Mycobacterium basiliense]VDM91168.1 6-pyruvoyl tetrahydropterin synthase [Mycobacterium basiliense]